MSTRNSRPSIRPGDIPASVVAPVVHIQGLKKPLSGPSLVTKDGIMKEVVKLEEDAKSSWDKKFGFLKNSQEQFEQELEKQGIIYQKSSGNKRRASNKIAVQSDLMQLPSQIPRTASGMVGWLAGNAANLNIAGHLYVSPKETALAPTQLFLKKQKHIILG